MISCRLFALIFKKRRFISIIQKQLSINSLAAIALIIISVITLFHPARAEAKESLLKNIMKAAKDRVKKSRHSVVLDESKKEENKEPERRDGDKNSKNNEEWKNSNDGHKKKDCPEEEKDMKKIEKYAEFASEKTGINKDYLMGMLVVESQLGQNTGQCTYKEVEEDAKKSHERGLLSDKAWQTFQDRKKTIESIAEELGYNPEKLKVSCNPANYAGTGGAMGPGQFMPDTWLEYKDRIAEIVGKKTPDPWNARDGIVAMALKLSDVPGVTANDVWSEKNASKLYLSGTTSWEYNWYANTVQYWKNNYKKLII